MNAFGNAANNDLCHWPLEPDAKTKISNNNSAYGFLPAAALLHDFLA
jgi:hypothetical protein